MISATDLGDIHNDLLVIAVLLAAILGTVLFR